MKKVYYSWKNIEGAVFEISRQINNSDWRPDYIVGITRGGLIPATLLSHYLNVPCETLKVSLRDGGEPESNLWMAEDAFGYVSLGDREFTEGEKSVKENRKNILIVDDINDTGATFNWIMKDWPGGCLPDEKAWETVWNGNVRFAVVVDNLASQCSVKMDYAGIEINKAEDDVWVDFPWENFWNNDN